MIRTNLREMLLEDTEYQLYNGDGTNTFTGFFTASGTIQGAVNTPSLLRNTAATAMAKAQTEAISAMEADIVAHGKTVPTHVIMHPNAWHRFRIMAKGDAGYAFGSPAAVGGSDNVPMLYGMTTLTSTFLKDTEGNNNALVGNFVAPWAVLVMRRGVQIEVGTINAQLTEQMRTIMASHRCVLQIRRASAFGTVNFG